MVVGYKARLSAKANDCHVNPLMAPSIKAARKPSFGPFDVARRSFIVQGLLIVDMMLPR